METAMTGGLDFSKLIEAGFLLAAIKRLNRAQRYLFYEKLMPLICKRYRDGKCAIEEGKRKCMRRKGNKCKHDEGFLHYWRPYKGWKKGKIYTPIEQRAAYMLIQATNKKLYPKRSR